MKPSAIVRPFPPLAYDPSAYEQSAAFRADSAPWTAVQLNAGVLERAAFERTRAEMVVHYYRIGYTLSFPLPVARRPTAGELPQGIATITYPWLIWLIWDLEERWRSLHAAWRLHHDAAAGSLLQQELAALAGWDRFHEVDDTVGLVTGHTAAVLALALADETGWDPVALAAAQQAADLLLTRDIGPWLPRAWPEGQPVDSLRLHNIPVIALVRAAQLARVRRHPLLATLDRQCLEVVRAWPKYRTGAGQRTEGTAYDGYMMDSVTGWLEQHPQRDALLAETQAAFRGQAEQWMALTLPGRLDLHAPVCDTEPEMTFWTTALARLARWYDWEDARWFLARVPVGRLPAAAVVEGLTLASAFPSPAQAPASRLAEHANAISTRTGWTQNDHVVILSTPRSDLGHLHKDGGHFVLGWQARFWITDPGYQQYRPGEERAYTLDLAAHNAPIVNGQPQDHYAARIVALDTDDHRREHARLDLTACYRDLPPNASVQRELWTAGTPSPLVVLRDRFAGLNDQTVILTHWLGGTHFAWSFVNGWARLSDGDHVLWIGASGHGFKPAELTRHAGSRGPLTLRDAAVLASGTGERWWVFCGDTAGNWTPPTLEVEPGRLTITTAATPDRRHRFGD